MDDKPSTFIIRTINGTESENFFTFFLFSTNQEIVQTKLICNMVAVFHMFKKVKKKKGKINTT